MNAGEEDLLEAIAGSWANEDPMAWARREALEEAGVALGALEPIGRFWSMPTQSTERLRFSLAPYVAGDLVSSGGGADDENENLTVHEVTLEELIEPGRIRDIETLLLVQALRIEHPDLFQMQTTSAKHHTPTEAKAT